MMRKVSLTAVILLCTVALGLSFLLQSPVFWKRAIAASLRQDAIALSVKKVNLDQAHLSLNGRLFLKNLTLKLRYQKASYFISIGSVELKDIWSLIRGDAQILLHIDHAALVSDNINISNASLVGRASFKAYSFYDLIGQLKLGALEYGQYQLTTLSALLALNPVSLDFSSLVFVAYQGQVTGKVHLDYEPRLIYDGAFDITDLDLSLLSGPLPALNAVKGLVKGDFSFKGNAKVLESFYLNAHQPFGGRVKAQLLQYLLAYIPQRKEIEALIKSNADIDLDRANVIIKSITGQSLTSQIKLLSSKLNLDVNVTLDLNVEGGLLNALGNLKQIAP